MSVSIFAMTILSAALHFVGVTEARSGQMAYIFMPIIILVALMAFGALSFVSTRLHLLTRPELVCIFFSMAIASPLIMDGFWRQLLSVTTTYPRTNNFARMQALSDKLWAHGPDLLADALYDTNANIDTRGNVRWHETRTNDGETRMIPILENNEGDELSAVRIRVPVIQDGRRVIILQEPHMISMMARAAGIGGTATYFCRVYSDMRPQEGQELFSSRVNSQRNFLQREGFVPVGNFGVLLSRDVEKYMILEFGLKGNGTLEFHSPKLMSVSGVTHAYTGVYIVDEDLYNELPEKERTGLILRPKKMWSWEGLKFVITGYIPWNQWWAPILAWSSFVTMLLLGTYFLNLIMRKQWIESERYPLPLAQVPLLLIGGPDENPSRSLAPLWRHRYMWAGYAIALFWCLMRLWYSYNSNVPNLEIRAHLKPYFAGEQWGDMWHNVTYTINAVFLSLAIFMELNVLLSFVVGYFLFRAQYWVGKSMDWTAYPQYPFFDYQTIASFLTYGILVLFFTRKYLWKVFKAGVIGKSKSRSIDEPRVYRFSFLGLGLTVLSMILWANWTDMPTTGILAFFFAMLMIAFVTAKIRAECGPPHAGFNPWKPYLFLTLAGGAYVFGAETMIFSTLASFIICKGVFFVLPGIQLELIELCRRYGMPNWNSFATLGLGLFGGVAIGGYMFLSGTYALGGENSPAAYVFIEKTGALSDVETDLQEANLRFEATQTGQSGKDPSRPYIWAILYSSVGTVILSVLRQMSAGFWFHPIGFIAGPTILMQFLWSNMLTAYVIRFLVLKIGGATTVREKLFPFFMGVLLASVTAFLVNILLNGYLMYYHPGVERFGLVF